ncbi:MAG: (5-formylfuran-3-yl)methyl phosphate synthase [Eubacteriales bacterium]
MMNQIYRQESINNVKPILLVSVANGQETQAALEGEADIIDIKNPLEGALGAPSPSIISEVGAALNGKKPLSIALGEFPGKIGAAGLAALGSAYFRPDYVKIGFVSSVLSQEILKTLKEIKKSIKHFEVEKEIQVVSVVFGDTINSSSWNLKEFASVSQEGGAAGCLIDTWEKKGKSLLDYLPIEEIERFIESCHGEKLFCGLAGSLKASDIVKLNKLNPDIIGVRSAVCGGDRLRGTVNAQSVKELKNLCLGC